MPFTFVTCYYELDKNKNEIYLDQFKKLLKMNFQVILFLDSKLKVWENEFKEYNNLKYYFIDWNNLPIVDFLGENINKLELPNNRNLEKDTKEFLILMNSKPYFLAKAKEYTTSDTLVWIDFGILKITNDLDHFKRNFSQLKKYNKILIPGGIFSKNILDENKLMEGIFWRFLGGIIICPRELVDDFCIKTFMEVLKLLNKNKITWEVNIWANIEYENPDMIHYYRADHNKSMFGLYDKKVILISMIKNEEKIIKRCIESVLELCDAFCVSDTMSTDNTVNIVKDLIKELNIKNIPGKLYQDPWSDFGKNRTISYNNTVDFCKELGWDQDNTYGLLLDADMKLKVLPTFNKQELTQNGYKIIQDNGHIEYYNTRFVKLNNSWKCVGVTHEYWDGSDLGTITRDKIYIHDIGDGGCKNDKFERDLRLLTKGIEEEPRNGRYHFYLAQTYKDLGKHKEAIKLYKKRIEIGGWDEEIWYSHYMIAKCWLSLGNVNKCEYWGNRAYEYRKSRHEPLYMLCNLFRDRGQQIKAYHYLKLAKNIPPSGDSLFVETNIYKYLLDYENTILHYWVYPNDTLSGGKICVEYINKSSHSEDNVYNNLDFYMQNLGKEGKIKNLNLPLFDNYIGSSSSIVELNNKLYVNLRYVNYRIQNDGSYMMYDNGTYNNHNNVRTKNAFINMDNEYNISTIDIKFIDNELKDLEKLDSGIRGVEDLRLFNFKDKIYYTGTTREYSYKKDINRIVFGEYDYNNLKLINNKKLKPPTETDCEKNWIPINHKNEKILFVYKWHPLQIGELDENNKLSITITNDTPKFFKHYRGSSPFVEYKNQLWCITHGVKYSTPRKYYHQFVVLDKETYKVIKYSVPFYFSEYTIEYCIGMHIKDDVMMILYSKKDKDTSKLTLDIDKINKYMINA